MRSLMLAAAIVSALLAGCAASKDGTVPDDLASGALSPPSVDAAAVLDDLASFASQFPERAGNLPAHVGARDWLASRMDAAGLQVWRQDYTENGLDQQNIVGLLPGASQPERWVVVGAHYDMVTLDCGQIRNAKDQLPLPGTVEDQVPQCLLRGQSQGAYDDGSGTMMVLHLAERFAASNQTYPYTLAFAAFDGEERGLTGSQAFYTEVLAGNTTFGNVTFHAMLDLDMVGLNCPGTDAPLLFDSNSAELDGFVAAYAKRLDPVCAGTIEYHGITLGRSDYQWFYTDSQGIPTGFFIGSFEEWQLPDDAPFVVTPPPVGVPMGRSAYPFWHLQDTYATMEAMAGSPEDLQAGFQFALGLAAGVLAFMASGATMTAEPPEA